VGRAAGSRRWLDTEDRRVLARFIHAWHRGDVAGLAAVLREDVVLRMPPAAMEFAGRDDVVGFFATVPGGGRLDLIRLVATRANGQPALAAVEPDADGVPRPYGLLVLDLDGGLVAANTGFPATPGRTIDAAFDPPPA
jgi:RNA polymerase sigma-70 factor (ECF subfamily)